MDKKQPIFAQGLSWKRPTDITKQKAPWVKGHMSINVPNLLKFIQEHRDGDWLNFDLKESKDKTKLYFELNTYKKAETKKSPYDSEEDVPLLGDEDINKLNGEIDAEKVFDEF